MKTNLYKRHEKSLGCHHNPMKVLIVSGGARQGIHNNPKNVKFFYQNHAFVLR